MLNENASNLKAQLKALHQNLAETGEVDEELQELLRQLDRDIEQLLEKREDEADADAFGLAERTQELSARFAVEHPRLEPTLRELGRILANMGI
jgi:arsenate reductase-like glutaredoxin family protein